MRLLALDLGTKKCGIAITDPMQIISQSLETFYYQSQNFIDLINHLVTIIERYRPIEKIILGYPQTNYQITNPMSKIVDKFYKQLKNHFNELEIILFNEANTSKAADQIMHQMNLSNKKKKQNRDQLAAQKILENYLFYNKK